jgi:hypothetical protein
MGLAHGDGEGMKFVEEPRLVFRGVRGKGLAGQIGQGLIALVIAARGWLYKPVTRDDAAQVLVGDRDGMAEGVEQNGVGGLKTYTGQGQQTAAQSLRGAGGEIFKRTGKFLVQHSQKRLQRGRLAAVKAGGLDLALQLFKSQRAQAVHGQGSSHAQVAERALDGLPGGVLREVGAEDDFKGSFGRPSVLRSVRLG